MIYQVFAKLNDRRRVISIQSSGFLFDSNGWVQIDAGSGDRFYHAQSSYFQRPITDDRGVYRYVLDDKDKPYELTQEEMDADYVPPIPQPTEKERITALEAQLASYEAAFAEGVSEGWA